MSTNLPKGWDNRIVGIGSAGIVSLYDQKETSVLKGYVVVLDGRVVYAAEDEEGRKRSLDLEHQAYKRLGSHDNILHYKGQVEVQKNVHSLHLEYASKGSLRSFIETNAACPVGMPLRLKWAVDLAAALVHIHSKRVYHCDFSCRNVFLTKDDVVKIGDFGGAGLDGNESQGVEESRYDLPLRGREWEERPYYKRDLFALGSALYEIMAWNKPFPELVDHEVENRFARDEFPDVSNIGCGDIIQKCWQEKYESAEQVMVELQAL
jgi:serine/threonine protein kinase